MWWLHSTCLSVCLCVVGVYAKATDVSISTGLNWCRSLKRTNLKKHIRKSSTVEVGWIFFVTFLFSGIVEFTMSRVALESVSFSALSLSLSPAAHSSVRSLQVSCHYRFALCIHHSFYPQLKKKKKFLVFCIMFWWCALYQVKTLIPVDNAQLCARNWAQKAWKLLSSHKSQNSFPIMPCCLNIWPFHLQYVHPLFFLSLTNLLLCAQSGA